jgi:hypothetical protein
MPNNLSRRAYLSRCCTIGITYAAAGFGTSGCAKQSVVSAACTDTSTLTAADKETRKSLAYVDVSPMANQTCQNCSIYVEASKAGQCGTCHLLKGDIAAEGYCNAWAAKAV